MQYVTELPKNLHGRDDLEVLVLRLELMTLGGCGNKHYKLSENIRRLKQDGCQTVLSFGGAWSNHLHALSVQAKLHGLGFVGIVRGDAGVSNELLTDAQRNGMKMVVVDRSEYRRRYDANYCRHLCEKYQCQYWLPEGGSTAAAVRGCSGIAALLGALPGPPDLITLAVGTGATLAGIVAAVDPVQSVTGLPVVRDDSVQGRIEGWLSGCGGHAKNWRLTTPLAPGYGKADRHLIDFILQIFDETGIVLDPVYTGKALRHVLSAGFTKNLPAKTRLVFVHTGGLMGSFGFKSQFVTHGRAELAEGYFAALNNLLKKDHSQDHF